MLNAAVLHLLCSPQLTAEDIRLARLARFLGLEVRSLTQPAAQLSVEEGALNLAATCGSLAAFQRQPRNWEWLSRTLSTGAGRVFITGLTNSAESLQAVETLVPGAVRAVAPAPPHGSYSIARTPCRSMRQLAGLSFGPIDKEADGVLRLSDSPFGVTELISIEGQPCYVKIDRQGSSYFLLACARVLDLDAPTRHLQPIDRFLRFAPFFAFLRSSFGAQCWHNAAPSACFVIDDPLLRERYGFLDLSRIESSMARSPFSLNVAFIPWNCRRTDPRIAERFKRPDRRFSISVHGCDHTASEFGVTDQSWLRRQSRQALARMDLHEGLTGIPHNRVMVFPQGVFSKASLQALADAGFVAAVNSTIRAVDAPLDEVTFRDLFDVAVVRFGGTPLFLRRYANKRHHLALDAFLGRQVIIVEHHGFFKNGYRDIERVAAFVNEIAPGIRWTDLEQLCASACLLREAARDAVQVRAFGSMVRLKNNRHGRVRFMISAARKISGVESVTWNGTPVDFEVGSDDTWCHLTLEPQDEGTLCFHRAPHMAPFESATPRLTERLNVFARRHLCEFRDNYLDRSETLSQLARRGMNALPNLLAKS